MKVIQNIKLLTFVLLALAVFSASAERKGFEHYQSIIDRQVFGNPPPGFDPTVPPSAVTRTNGRGGTNGENGEELTQEQAQLKGSVKFSVINRAADGTVMVGFSDTSDAKSPRTYYLRVGETRDGWMVKEADPVKATATIVKGEIEVPLALGSSSNGGGAKDGNKGGPATASAPSAPNAGLRSKNSVDSLRNRRRARLAMQQEEQARAAKAQEEEKTRREQERAQEKAEREAEREEQRNQLFAIREELKKAREERAANPPAAEPSANASSGDSAEGGENNP